ncbi:MAG: hypothetical protein QW655_07360, partial [Nitrososphaerota archaeon]
MAEKIGKDVGSVAKSVEWLRSKNLVEVHEIIKHRIELGEEGREYAYSKLPERKLVDLLKESGGSMRMEDVNKILGER